MTAPATAPMPPRRRPWLRWLGLALLFLLVLLIVTAGWLAGTTSGLRFVLARVQAATHGMVHVQQAQGRLLGPLDLGGVRYDDGKGTVVKVTKAHLDFRFWPLLDRRMHLLALDAEGVDVALPPSTPDDNGSESFSLQPPVDLLLDHVHVGAVKVSRAGRLWFASDRLDMAGDWTHQGIALRQLALQAPDGHVDLAGTLVIGQHCQGNGHAGFRWKLGGTDYAGSLVMHGDGKQAHVDLSFSAPTTAQLQLTLSQGGDYAWTATLDAPRFDPQPLLGDSSLKTLGVAVQGHGDRYGGTLQGKLDLDDYQLLLQPLRASFSHDFNTLVLHQLELGSPQIKGHVAASGSVQLDAKPLSAELNIRWSDLLLPTELAGQVLASHGELKASGSTAKYHAAGDVAIGPPGKLAALALDLDGTPKQISLHTLTLKQPQGQLQTNGVLTLQPALAWQAEARADRLDPGQLFAGWNGTLDADIASSGSLPKTGSLKGGPDVVLEIRKLAGTLRDRTVSTKGKLHLSPDEVVDGQLQLSSGGSTVQLEARPDSSNNVDLRLAIASLGDWLPNAGGRLDGHFNIGGRLPKLSINGQLQGQSVRWQQQWAQTLHLIAGIPDISHLAGKLDLQATGVHLQELTFQRINLLAEGSEGDHRLDLNAHGSQLSGVLALHGARKGDAWNGTLATLNLEPQGMPGWRLQQPTQLGYRAGAMNLSELCLSAGDPLMCVAAKQDKGGNLDASYRLHALPLALLLNAAGETELPIRADGVLDGAGKLHRNANGAFSGSASLNSAQGSITYTDRPDAPVLSYDQLNVDAELTPASQRINLHSGLDQTGRLDGQIILSGAQQTLGGQLTLRLNNLALLELLSNDLASVKGRLDGAFHFAGTLQQPAISGQAAVADFAAEVPATGLKLSQGQLTVVTTDARQFRIDGSVQSGKGSIAIHGTTGLGADARTAITLKGSQFTATDIPAAKVVMSPDLTVQQNANGITVGGGVGIDSADVNVEKLPGAGATKASPDVVVIDEKQREQASGRLPISAQVKVDLGGKTHLVGMGLDGRLSGVLTVIERPGRATTGQGQVAVSGTYRAYGQSLQIQRGQLLFASTPIDNPGLNIRAMRTLNPTATIDEGQEVGLLVSGTAQRPILTVFSNPVMEQSDALSYLVTGKPLSQVKGGEGDMVGAAAQALGSAAGDLLAKSVGTKLGVDDIGVSSNAALGGSSAFTVGKYLSLRLYLSYGVGLFEPGEVITLRYRLSHRWNLEAQNATDFSRASLNYRYEK